jgi:hypothetical protein
VIERQLKKRGSSLRARLQNTALHVGTHLHAVRPADFDYHDIIPDKLYSKTCDKGHVIALIQQKEAYK